MERNHPERIAADPIRGRFNEHLCQVPVTPFPGEVSGRRTLEVGFGRVSPNRKQNLDALGVAVRRCIVEDRVLPVVLLDGCDVSTVLDEPVDDVGMALQGGWKQDENDANCIDS